MLAGLRPVEDSGREPHAISEHKPNLESSQRSSEVIESAKHVIRKNSNMTDEALRKSKLSNVATEYLDPIVEDVSHE